MVLTNQDQNKNSNYLPWMSFAATPETVTTLKYHIGKIIMMVTFVSHFIWIQ